jgi:hypothetical protein
MLMRATDTSPHFHRCWAGLRTTALLISFCATFFFPLHPVKLKPSSTYRNSSPSIFAQRMVLRSIQHPG